MTEDYTSDFKLSQKAIKFINNVQDLIDKNDFQEIYARLAVSDYHITHELTAAFNLVGINPLDHLDYIPAEYYMEHYLDRIVKIPENITLIGSFAFEWSSQMKECYIPEGCTCIYNSAFKSSEDLTDLYIPYSVTNIGSMAIDPDVTIHCVKNSVAEEFARFNGNEFKYDYRY